MDLTSSALVAVLLMIAAPSSAARVNISEIFYDATGSDDGLVFVELYGPAAQSLEGFVLQGVNGSNGRVTVELGLRHEAEPIHLTPTSEILVELDVVCLPGRPDGRNL